MRRLLALGLLLATALTAVSCGWFSRGDKAGEPQGTVLFRGVQLIDGTGAPARSGVSVLVRDGRIAAVGNDAEITLPDDAREINLAGKTLMPGLISAHSHLAASTGLLDGTYTDDSAHAAALDQLRQYQRFGVTGIAVLGATGDLVNRLHEEQRRGRADGASLLPGSDRGIGVQGGAPPMSLTDAQIYRPETPEQAREAVRDSARRPTAMVKLWIDDFRQIGRELPKMRPEIYEAVIEEARTNDLKVAAHVYYLDDAKALLHAGADIIAHGVRDQAVDEEFIELMKANNAWYIATLVVDESFFVFADQPRLLDDPVLASAVTPTQLEQWRSAEWRGQVQNNLSYRLWREGVATGQDNLKRLVEAGVNVTFGTDSGANPQRVPGYAEHRELLLSVGAGLEPVEAIALATGQAAAALGLSDRGVIAPGRRADLIVLSGDPSQDIAVMASIEQVWQAGREVAGALPSPSR